MLLLNLSTNVCLKSASQRVPDSMETRIALNSKRKTEQSQEIINKTTASEKKM